jgi:hypothetical protein
VYRRKDVDIYEVGDTVKVDGLVHTAVPTTDPGDCVDCSLGPLGTVSCVRAPVGCALNEFKWSIKHEEK